MNDRSAYILYNGQILPESEVTIFPVNRGMMYGDGCFDTLTGYQGRFLHLEEHFDRLKQGAGYLGMDVDFDLASFRSKLQELLSANSMEHEDAVLRVQCWREGGRGYYTDSRKAAWLTTCSARQENAEPLRLATASVRAIPPEALARKYKLSNGLNYIQAAREARSLGADDALMLTVNGVVSETSVANIFWVKDSTVYTPSEECDLLPGITRKILIGLIREMKDTQLEEGRFTPDAVLRADAVWCSNSVREILAVQSLDEQRFDPDHACIRELRSHFKAYKSQNLR